jgi:hypothetical protein
MKNNPLNQGVLTENSAGIGLVTAEMVQRRAEELALIAGHTSSQVSQADYEQAKRELTGGPEADAQDILLESIPQAEGWDRIPGATGHQVEDSSSEDENADGQSESAQLVEQGSQEAGHDQMLQAARTSAKLDRLNS